MISINKTKDGQFFVRITAKNNAVLMNGEPLKKKDSAIKQIWAVAKETGARVYDKIKVRDNTLAKPEDIWV